MVVSFIFQVLSLQLLETKLPHQYQEPPQVVEVLSLEQDLVLLQLLLTLTLQHPQLGHQVVVII